MSTSPQRHLPNWINAFLEMEAGKEPSSLFFEWTAIFCLTAAMQRKCWVYVGDNINYPMLYIVLVGPSGCGKGTAMKSAIRILEDLKLPMAADVEAGKGIYKSWKNSNKITTFPGTDFPEMRHCSLAALTEEFTTLVTGDDQEFITRLCLIYDTKKSEIIDKSAAEVRRIPGAFMTILGGTTPKTLKEALPRNLIGSGLTARINFVYGRRPPRPVIDDSRTLAQLELYPKLLHDIGCVYTLRGQFEWHKKAFALYGKWRNARWNDVHRYGPNFEHYMDRCKVYSPRIAMAYAVSRGNFNFTILPEDFERVIDLLERTEKDLPMVFEAYGANYQYDTMKAITATIMDAEGEISYEDVVLRHIRDARERDIKEILNTMVKVKTCKERVDGETFRRYYTYNRRR